jgi:hypothetical protein
MRNSYRILVRKLEGKRPRCERIVLKWMLGKLGRKLWTGFIWLRIQTTGRLI